MFIKPKMDAIADAVAILRSNLSTKYDAAA
jgi:hypothetical protein